MQQILETCTGYLLDRRIQPDINKTDPAGNIYN